MVAAASSLPPLRPATPAPLAPQSLTLDLAAAEDGRWIAVGERGHILLRTRARTHWRQLPSPTDDTLTAVAFSPDGRTGLIVGHGGLVLRSQDGGLSWHLAHRAEDPTTVYLDVLWTGPEHAVISGAYGRLLRTADSGASFVGQVLPDEMHLNRLGYVAATGSLYIAGESGMLLRSPDLGESWEQLAPPYEGSLFLFAELSDGAILVGGLRGHLFRSGDGGDTWTDIPGVVSSLLSGAASSTDGRTVLVVASGGPGLISHDGGHTFLPWPLPYSLADVAVLDGNSFLAVGEKGPIELSPPTP